MKCPYCGREVTPIGANCPKCKAAIMKLSEPKKPEYKKEEN